MIAAAQWASSRAGSSVQPCRIQQRESVGAGVCIRRTVGRPGAAAARLTYAETVGPLGELGALFNPGMRHEIEERKSKANRREEEGNARDGDIRIDLASGVAVINLPSRPEPTAAAPGETEAETSESGHIEPDDTELADRADHGEPDNSESNNTVPKHRAADSDELDDTNDRTPADPTDDTEAAALIPPVGRPTARERASSRSVSSKAASHAASGTKPSDSKPSAAPGNSARTAQTPRSKASRAAR